MLGHVAEGGQGLTSPDRDPKSHPVMKDKAHECNTSQTESDMHDTHTTGRGVCLMHLGRCNGGANPAMRNLGNYRGTGELVPFCACGSPMAKWTYAFPGSFGAQSCIGVSAFLLPSPKIQGKWMRC